MIGRRSRVAPEDAQTGRNPAGPDGSPGTFANGTLTFTKRPEAVANGDVTYTIESSPDLTPGSWDPVTADINDGSIISFTMPAGEDRLFLRLAVELAP